jgi:hypothetical protein
MRLKGYLRFCRMRFLFISSIVLFVTSFSVLAQPDPPRPITVTVTQNLTFGAFYHGASGGTVTIGTDGSRSSTVSVVLLNLVGYPYFQAIYRVTGRPGTLVSLLNGPDALLPGSNGGSISLHIGNSNPASPFITVPGGLSLNVGGTLIVGNSTANPPGNYSGTFDLTFILE